MVRLTFTLSFLLLMSTVFGQSPHGKSLKADCSLCHTSAGWKFDRKSMLFDHDSTTYKLVGMHKEVNCRSCHKSLEFPIPKQECIDCHKDLHEGTLSPDCSRCHTPATWIVENVSQIHRQSRFPLTGAHQLGDCKLCHKSGSVRRFEPLGIECLDCHKDNYLATTKPNHTAAGYSTDCVQCHKAGSAGWVASNIEHTFFPLTGGHELSCLKCHVDGDYKKIPTECVSCHQKDFTATSTPNHQQINLSTNCLNCHTTDKGWKPARFDEHDARFFPIKSGSHANAWNVCADCHKQTGDFTSFTCTDCHDHRKPVTDEKHKQTNGYQYNSVSCFTCHPRGDKESGFNHSKTNFPLTGAHLTTDCIGCHSKGFAGTSIDCYSCHRELFEGALLHKEVGIPIGCEACHTTNVWSPSTFNHDNTGFPLTGAHKKVIKCGDCHNGVITDTRSECVSCHRVQYDNAREHKARSYPLDCKGCHNVDSWQGASFDHATTKFPLIGAHVSTTCASCHANGNYAGTPMDCNFCHSKNYNSSQNPNHVAAGLPVLCENCHTPTAWKPSTFNHATTGFALTGGHARFTQCSECHKGTTQNMKTDCIICHQVQYDNAKDHKSQAYPIDCKMCHNGNTWLNASFNHSLTGFPLSGVHTTTLCAKCHVNGYAGTKTDCNSCHAAKYVAAQSPNHATAGIPVLCENCHNPNGWKPSTFNHVTTGFTLTGGHSAIVQCSQCHKGTLQNAKTECIACHQVQYDGAKDHKAQSYPLDCKLCHNPNNWQNASFNHSLTGFPLTGVHTTTLCAKCHTNGYAGTKTDCNSCHASKFAASQSPNHIAAGIPTLCVNCHNTTAWRPSSFNHVTTGFALSGGHAAITQCSLCHKGTLQNTRTECIACHQVQYDGAKDHKAQSYPVDCKLCHNPNNWLNASFNHSQTGFPLTGAHSTTLCAKCHTSGYAGTPTACNSCHAAKFTASASPNHVAAGIPRLCETCHNTTAWKPSTFNHVTTGFALTGGHAAVAQCSQCHKGTMVITRTDCLACHQVQYDVAKDHKAQSYPVDCKLCHNANNWLNATFNHSQTGFPLTGAHSTTLCAKCHPSGFAGTPTACNSCHAAKFTAAVNPNHVAAGIPVQCETCHNSTAWKPSTFSHVTTGFALTGGHAAVVQCSQCHKGSVLTAKTDCISCHQVQYDGAKDHKAQSYPIDCKMCHNANNWLNASFNHSATSFPLTGAHVSTTCSKCHTNGFPNTPSTCSACHLANYNATTDPNHKTLAFSVNCNDCHTTNAGWTPATFAIHSTYWPLTGAHATIATNCVLCHKGNYTTTPNTCYACHTAKYNSVTNPNHVTAQFPKECETCHTMVAWKPSTFNHDSQYFRINSGKHQGKWTLCTECHTTPTNYGVFNCLQCHQHSNKASVDADHRGRSGYSYTSAACFSCHGRV